MDDARTLFVPFPDPLFTLPVIPPRLVVLSDLFTLTLPTPELLELLLLLMILLLMLLLWLVVLLLLLLFELPKLELFTLLELIFILCRPPGLEDA